MTRRRLLAECVWALLALGLEGYLFVSYRAQEARFHWFTHFFVGASVALLLMAGVVVRTRRPVPFQLLWPALGHLVAMFPDFLFSAGIAHQRWMDLFLGHISTHFMPGRNITWYGVFLISLALYLAVLDRRAPSGRPLIRDLDTDIVGGAPAAGRREG